MALRLVNRLPEKRSLSSITTFFIMTRFAVSVNEDQERLPQTSSSPPLILLLAVPRRLFCLGSLVVLDVVFRYLSFFLLCFNIK